MRASRFSFPANSIPSFFRSFFISSGGVVPDRMACARRPATEGSTGISLALGDVPRYSMCFWRTVFPSLWLSTRA